MAEEIVNKVAQSGLITLSLEDYYPRGTRCNLDLAPWLYQGIMLREKDFRAAVEDHNWEQYRDAYVAIYCSEDAIIPQWAYMLVGAKLAGIAARSVYGNQQFLEALLLDEALSKLAIDDFRDQRVILKGCGDLPIPPQAYLRFAERLQPLVKSLMFGEACSTVPIYKKPKVK
jgi:Protein of unknown function (DUF2480).